jgi:uncharacterized protein YndB with AHSA1/START domain
MPEDQQPIKQDIVVKRVIDAPVELVWKAWTDPEYIKRWWGPSFYTSPSAKVDLKEGGSFTFCMEAPPEQGGVRHYSTGVYKKIVEHKLLEFSQFLSDENGMKIDPASVGMPLDFPHEIHTQIKFRTLRPDLTELTIVEKDWTMGQMAIYSELGLHQTITKLEEAIKK